MKFEESRVYFDDGTEIYAYSGVIGLGPHGAIHGGFDSVIHSDNEYQDNLRKEHVIELADYMIAQWESVKRRAQESDT